MARTDWLQYPYYQLPDPGLVDVPQPGGRTTKMAGVEYDLAEAISQDIRGFGRFLLKLTDRDPQYRSPAAYRDNLIAYADSLTHFSYSPYIVPTGWDATEAGTRYTQILCDTLKNIPVNASYPDTNNVYDAWIDDTGFYYGGVRP